MEGITMPKSKKLTAVYALIMDLPLSIVVTMVALALGGNLTMERFIPSFCLAYVLTFFINFPLTENNVALSPEVPKSWAIRYFSIFYPPHKSRPFCKIK